MDDCRILYNDTCPVCRREVKHYGRHAAKKGVPLRLDPLRNAADFGLTDDQAARALHVMVDGQVLRGLPAFQAVWDRLPGYGWLATVTRLPVIRPAAALAYDRVLAPLIYRWHLARLSRSGSPATQGRPRSR
jgi:predicted DCC family thiol-disulfide oxidoreductase YuxK